ncbi:MAG: hypothetical protein K9H65_04175 [Bacteroidales bacterium]|nr:hypothetical protein [Bacteroidales bacterium]
MKWNIDYELMVSRDSNEKASWVINDIVEEFERLIPEGPPLGYKPINLINDTEGGPTLYWPLGHDFYKIGLNISDIFYNQVAFQFSQEFSRIYCDPRISNWFIELIGHVTALYMLEYLSEKWENNPPFPELADYHEKFTDYRSNLLGTAFSKIDMVKYQISNEWVKNQLKKLMNKESYNRGKLLLIAYEILGLFKESDAGWRMLPYVGKCSDPAPSDDIHNMATNRKNEPNFTKLLKEVPQDVYPFVEQLINKFGVFEGKTK